MLCTMAGELLATAAQQERRCVGSGTFRCLTPAVLYIYFFRRCRGGISLWSLTRGALGTPSLGYPGLRTVAATAAKRYYSGQMGYVKLNRFSLLFDVA